MFCSPDPWCSSVPVGWRQEEVYPGYGDEGGLGEGYTGYYPAILQDPILSIF